MGVGREDRSQGFFAGGSWVPRDDTQEARDPFISQAAQFPPETPLSGRQPRWLQSLRLPPPSASPLRPGRKRARLDGPSCLVPTDSRAGVEGGPAGWEAQCGQKGVGKCLASLGTLPTVCAGPQPGTHGAAGGTSCPIWAALWPKGDRMEPHECRAGRGEVHTTGCACVGQYDSGCVCVRERKRDARRQRQGQIQGAGVLSQLDQRKRPLPAPFPAAHSCGGPVTPVPSQPVSWSQ